MAFTKTQEPYERLLSHEKWLFLREEILERDKRRCAECGAEETRENILQVHHKYYINNHDPWEYPKDALVTLCSCCHKKVHDEYKEKNEFIPVFGDESRIRVLTTEPCKRCNGSGYMNQYWYYKGGVCFRCYGERFEHQEKVLFDYCDRNLTALNDIPFKDISEFPGGIPTIVLRRDEEGKPYVQYSDNNGLLHYGLLYQKPDFDEFTTLNTKDLLYRRLKKDVVVFKYREDLF